MKTDTQKREWKEYQKKRRAVGITMLVPDEEVKQRILDAAHAERRSVNNWCQEHLLGHVIRELDKQERARNVAPAAATSLTAEDVLALIRRAMPVPHDPKADRALAKMKRDASA